MKRIYLALACILGRWSTSKAFMWAYKRAMKAYMDAEDDPIIGYFKFSHDYFEAKRKE